MGIVAAGLTLFSLFSVVISANPLPNGGRNALENAPYPPSPVIKSFIWAPRSSIMRAAKGSDNWPITWADDGHMYTTYGDGWGFEGINETQKLSLGFARIEGDAENWEGFDIDSAGEKTGSGPAGEKGSGILMVNGVLYLWVRNADNQGKECRVAKSTDYSKKWEWADWKFAQFGYCTFINYGKNYAGARDDYVYMVTPDKPSAYEAADQFALTRVPKDSIMDRPSYEFFVDLDGNDNPIWSSNINERGSVFTHENGALRSALTYNAALSRYIWWQGIPDPDLDERSALLGFGVYDAPEPWGPWTTVYYTEAWDIGPGETASFPTKWMSEDGKTMYLVSSTDDYFSVRKATLEPPPSFDEFIYLPLIKLKPSKL